MVGFMCVEIATGVIAHPLALLSDTGHMLTDAAAIGLPLLAVRLAQRPGKGAMTYGLKRVEILSAQANGVTLLVLDRATWSIARAARRSRRTPARSSRRPGDSRLPHAAAGGGSLSGPRSSTPGWAPAATLRAAVPACRG
jgi:hypothetical protein